MDIAFINCSNKTENSTTEFLFKLLNKEKDFEIKYYKIYELLENKAIIDKLMFCDKLVLGLPLYIDFFPSQCVELLEYLEENKDRFNMEIKLYIVINSGYIDPNKNRLAIDGLKIFAKKTNINWGGALAVGAGEMIKNNFNSKVMTYRVKKDFLMGIDKFTRCIWNDEEVEDLYVSYNLSRKLYILLSKLHWIKIGKGNGIKKLELYNTPFFNEYYGG